MTKNKYCSYEKTMFFEGDKVDCIKNGELFQNCTVQTKFHNNGMEIFIVYLEQTHNIMRVNAANIYKPGTYKLCPHCGKIKHTNTDICYLCGKKDAISASA